MALNFKNLSKKQIEWMLEIRSSYYGRASYRTSQEYAFGGEKLADRGFVMLTTTGKCTVLYLTIEAIAWIDGSFCRYPEAPDEILGFTTVGWDSEFGQFRNENGEYWSNKFGEWTTDEDLLQLADDQKYLANMHKYDGTINKANIDFVNKMKDLYTRKVAELEAKIAAKKAS